MSATISEGDRVRVTFEGTVDGDGDLVVLKEGEDNYVSRHLFAFAANVDVLSLAIETKGAVVLDKRGEAWQYDGHLWRTYGLTARTSTVLAADLGPLTVMRPAA